MNVRSFSRIGKRLSTFVGGQSSVQVLNAATGLALLRLLSKSDYAIYAIAVGVQAMIAILTDVGFGGAILGLVGTRFRDKQLLGSYIKAASYLRRMLLLFVTCICIIGLVALRHTRFVTHSGKEETLLAVAVLVTVQFQAWASYYEAPLLLNNRLVSYYAPQIAAAVLRMAAAFLLYYTHVISASTVVIANTLSIVVMGLSFRILARPWIEVPRKLSREHAHQMIRYLLPIVPGSIYQALQGQISLFLITVFGHVGQIAEVAAAGRIGQLFLLLNSSNTVLVTPAFAKTPRALFPRRFGYVMAAVGVVALLMAISVNLLPGPYLFLLGEKYSNLTPQVQLVVYASAVSYMTGTMWAIVVARKWIFWWTGTLHVVVLTLTQIACVILLSLKSSEGVLKMNLCTSIAVFAVQVFYMVRGYAKHNRDEAEQATAC